MSVATRGAISELKHRPGRLIAVVLAITIGSLFAVATTVFSSTAGKAVEVVVAESLQNADIVVSAPTTNYAPTSDLKGTVAQNSEKIKSTKGVAAVAPIIATYAQVKGSKSLSGIALQSVIQDEKLSYAKLKDGRFPTAPSEIAIDPSTAQSSGLKIGQQMTVRTTNDGEATFTIVGITDPNPATEKIAGSVAWVTQEYLEQDSTARLDSFLVRVDGNADDVAGMLNSNLKGSGLEALSGQAARDKAVEAVSGGTVALGVLLGSFAAIALVVAGVVIANTFTILLAQRRRQIALQRLVGATSAQMKKQILLEALLIGIGGTLLGAVLGMAAGYFGAHLVGADAGGFSINPVMAVIACLATIAATLLSAYVPIRKAAAAKPIEALRPADSELSGRRLPMWRMITAGVLFLLGGGLLAMGALTHNLGIGTLGGLLSVLGVLFGAQLIVLPIGRLLRPFGSMFGTPGKIAARDVTRYAGRATSTVVAIIVGLGLMTMIQVASSIVRATALAQVADSDMRDQIEAILDIMTNVATGLLAVTAIIAIIGIANTLALSVIERKRESGLMRALGVRRGQLRLMVSVEAVILALIGGIVGIVLGVGYGIIAAYTTIGDRGSLEWSIPWGRLGIFLLAAIVGGLLASVLPAIRSGKVSPIEALATA